MYNASPGIYAPVPVRLRSQPIIDWPTSYETRARPSSIISECNECIMDADSKLRPISTNLFDFGRILIDIYRVSCDLRPFNYPYGERRPDFGKRRCLSRVLRKRKKEGADYSRSRDGRKKEEEFRVLRRVLRWNGRARGRARSVDQSIRVRLDASQPAHLNTGIFTPRAREWRASSIEKGRTAVTSIIIVLLIIVALPLVCERFYRLLYLYCRCYYH